MNGTVTDNLTGLIWLKNANCDGTKGWANALTWSNNLKHGDCGLADNSTAGQWRLPNRKELQSLVDRSKSGPALPAGYDTFFSNVQSNGYWSSSTYAGPYYAWRVSMDYGNVDNYSRSSSSYVWPVRAGQ